jgi:hypothetical protein
VGDVVLLEGRVNLGVTLLRVELEVVTLLKDNVDTAADLLELMVDDENPELVPTEDLTELALTEDITLLEAHAFVFGVYNGPSGG